jgi:hypothetical protein
MVLENQGGSLEVLETTSREIEVNSIVDTSSGRKPLFFLFGGVPLLISGR